MSKETYYSVNPQIVGGPRLGPSERGIVRLGRKCERLSKGNSIVKGTA